ncbi:LPS assembly protein LptD [Nitratifractor sp.]|uniref:LPS-assembly protein LptD n=1 Tax=Nitratifractor sp. TaxID=2268144 RepID=UPI0025F7F0A9|nr:LPS assembly protein LptD [Nitratifractor sp.]
MRKLPLLLFLFLGAILEAAVATGDNQGLAELYADSFESRDHTVYAKGHVVLAYDGTLFLGDRATYDRQANRIVLQGHVEVLSNRGGKVLADKLVFEVDKNHVTFSDFYHTDRDDIWVYADDAEKQDGNYTLRNSVLSSCSVEDPDWSVKFGEAVYDSETKYMRLHDVKFYAGKTPLFYTPYLGFSLERQRHSGFLMPRFGYGKDEGYYYEQPYFWAIAPSMDLELNPLIRSKRGYGLYGTFRFVDSPWSRGEIRTGYFRDKNAFVNRHDLENKSHYGFELLYESGNFLQKWKPEGYQDGLYANLNLFNDIDYRNLQYSTLNHLEEESRFQESRVNYFLYNDDQYFGFRTRYFIDTTSKENNATIQELPALEYHKFTAELGNKFLHYSFDAQLRNYWRKDGTRALQGIATLPVEFHTALFEDFLNLSVKEELSASDTKFMEENSLHIGEDHYAALVLHHDVELSSDLVRGYASGLHTMLLAASFTKSTLLAEGDLSYNDLNPELVDDYDLDRVYDSCLAFKMHHFWQAYASPFSADYLVTADYYPDNDSRWNELRQELHLSYGNYRFSSRIDYSLRHHALSQLANTLSYRSETFAVDLTHTRIEEEEVSQNEIGVDLRYKQNDRVTWYGGYSYDFKAKSSKDWKGGILYDKKCWNITLIFKREITPALTKNGRGSLHNNSITFQFNLVPFGGVGNASHEKL